MDEKMCQSCAMPLNEEKFLGTNEDGSKNSNYCAYCFQKGSFVQPNLTLSDQIDINIKFANEMGLSDTQARKLAEYILPTLGRWKKT